MKNILLMMTLLCFAGSVFYSCSQGNSAKEPVKDLTRYPNPDSELALLMRSMYTDAGQIKKALAEKKMPEDFRQKFAALHTATPTDTTVRTPAFSALSKEFLKNLDQVYSGQNQVEGFNQMVKSCIACHQMVCPGPIKRIQKLHI